MLTTTEPDPADKEESSEDEDVPDPNAGMEMVAGSGANSEGVCIHMLVGDAILRPDQTRLRYTCLWVMLSLDLTKLDYDIREPTCPNLAYADDMHHILQDLTCSHAMLLGVYVSYPNSTRSTKARSW
jgi:hypothetical protein